MKKVYKTAFIAVAVLITGYGGYKAYETNALNNQLKSDILIAENVNALSDGGSGESGPNLYTRETFDCKIVAAAGSTVNLKTIGITMGSMKVGAEGYVIFEDVGVECTAGGLTLCSPRECADFLIEIIAPSSDSNDSNDSSDKGEKKEDKKKK